MCLPATKPTYISTIYRPPTGNVENFLELIELYVLQFVDDGPCDIVILGDMNLDIKQLRSTNVKMYTNSMKRLGLSQLVKSYTRVTITSKSLIDHIWTNNDELYPRAGNINPGASDHNLIFTARKKDKLPQEHVYIECRSYRNFSPALFQQDIDQIDWEPLMNLTDIDALVSEFHQHIIQVVDTHAPTMRIKFRLFAPDWMTSDYLAHVDEREHWSKKFDQCPCPYHDDLKWEAIRRTKHLRDELKANYFKDNIIKCGNDSKKKWDLIRKYWPGKNKSYCLNQ